MLFDLFDFFHSREISKPGDSRSELNVKFDRRLRSTGCDMNELSKLMASKLGRWMWVLDMLHNVPDTKLSICPVSRELPNWVGFFFAELYLFLQEGIDFKVLAITIAPKCAFILATSIGNIGDVIGP